MSLVKDTTNCQCLHGTPIIDANGNCGCQDTVSFPQTTGRKILDSILAANSPAVINTGAQGVKMRNAVNATSGITDFLKAHPFIIGAAAIGIIYYFFFHSKAQVKSKESATKVYYA